MYQPDLSSTYVIPIHQPLVVNLHSPIHHAGLRSKTTSANVHTLSLESATKIEIISITKRVTSHFSSDLSSGRRPESKSVEKCEVTLLVIEI